MTVTEWRETGTRLHGADVTNWKFVCPCCGHVASPHDYKAANAPSTAVAFSCIGRYSGAKRKAIGGDGPGPCDYASSGMFNLNPILVTIENSTVLRLFAFAQPTGE